VLPECRGCVSTAFFDDPVTITCRYDATLVDVTSDPCSSQHPVSSLREGPVCSSCELDAGVLLGLAGRLAAWRSVEAARRSALRIVALLVRTTTLQTASLRLDHQTHSARRETASGKVSCAFLRPAAKSFVTAGLLKLGQNQLACMRRDAAIARARAEVEAAADYIACGQTGSERRL
jgi:hypothetical protein